MLVYYVYGANPNDGHQKKGEMNVGRMKKTQTMHNAVSQQRL